MNEPVMITITPLATPARDLPMGMVFEVAEVLAAHGLAIRAAAKETPAVWAELLLALGRIIDATPVEHGGRADS